MEEVSTWVYTALITAALATVMFFATRSSDWYYRKVFTMIYYHKMLLGSSGPIFPPDSKPPSRESLAMTSIFGSFPKTNVPKPVLERRAAFDRIGVLMTQSKTTKKEAPIEVPLLPPVPAIRTQSTVLLYPIRPAVTVHGKVILYLHAGTYISGSITSHAKFVSHIAEHTHRLTYFVEYCRGPEAPVPNCVLDVISAYHWLVHEKKYRESDISIVGDSAGGGLTFLALQEMRARGWKFPGSIWVMSPWTDLSCSGSSWKTHLKSDVMLNPYDFKPGSVTLETATGIAKSTVEQLQSPLISPLFAQDYTNFPKALIQVGGAECLLSDSVEMHRKLVQARSSSTLQVYDHQQHIFQLYYDWIPESRQAVHFGCHWICQDDAANK